MSYNTSEFRGEAHNPMRIANAGADYFSVLENELNKIRKSFAFHFLID